MQVKSRYGKRRDGIGDHSCRHAEIDERCDDHVARKPTRRVEEQEFT